MTSGLIQGLVEIPDFGLSVIGPFSLLVRMMDEQYKVRTLTGARPLLTCNTMESSCGWVANRCYSILYLRIVIIYDN
jgi:hypothetical protein